MYKILFLFFLFGQFNLFGQDTLAINKDSIQRFLTKEEIGGKAFKRLGLNYYDFVNPGQEFNPTDIYHPRLPRCRVILFIKDLPKQNYIFFYECGGYGGAEPLCKIGLRGKGKYELFDLVDRIENKDEFVQLIETVLIRIKPSWRTR